MGLSSVSVSKQAAAKAVSAIENVEDTFTKVRKFRQINEADAYVFEKFNALKSIAAEDMDFDATRYEVEIEKIGAEATKTISGELAKSEFMAHFRKQAIATNWGIKNSFRERELVAYNASIEYERQQLVNSYAGMTPAEQMSAVANFKTKLMGGVESKILTQARAQQINSSLQEDVQKSVVDSHIIADPDTTLIGLKEGKEGPYPGISDQFRADSVKKAEAYSKKYKAEGEAERKRQVDANENDIVIRMIDPQKQKPSEGEIITLMNSESISPRFAKAAVENIRKAKDFKPDVLQSIVKFNELVERNATMARKEKSWLGLGRAPFDEIVKFRADVINANTNNYISDKQMTDLLSDTSKTFYREPIFQNALNQLAAQSKLYAASETQARVKSEMYGNLITKVIAGKNPQQAVQEVIQERLNTELGEAVKIVEQEGRIFAKKANQRIYSEDGGVTWKNEKTGEEIK